MIIKTRNSYIEYGHHGMHALLRMSCIVMFPPTEIPKEIDTSHRSSSQKGWAESERKERLCLWRTEARSQGKFSGCVAQIQAANNAHAEGRPTGDCGCAYWQRIWDRHHPLELRGPKTQICPKISKLKTKFYLYEMPLVASLTRVKW